MLTRPFDQLEFVERIPTWLVTNQQETEFQAFGGSNANHVSYLYAINWWSMDYTPGIFEMDIKI
jgi:hypothetical protein